MRKRIGLALLAIANLLAGGFLVIGNFAYSSETATDLGFAISIGLAIFGLTMVVLGLLGAVGEERAGQTLIGGLTAIVAGWTIVASRTFDDETARWFIFAGGCAHIALAVVSLLMHEVATARAVETLETGREREAP